MEDIEDIIRYQEEAIRLYTEMEESGDCGTWDLETDLTYVNMVKVLKYLKEYNKSLI